MKILILGSGGREHALAWAVKQNPKCDTLLCAPGNAGIAKIADCHALD
ncbi:MAG: phosphoribosylamine--glycine ligase N-terminal domain-containing protein, partial [Paracoccaceae bacterium]